MSESDRDRSVEHMLRRVLSENAETAAPGSCLDGETIAAWTAGSLRPDEVAGAERHVADCARCRTLMAAFVQTTPVVVPEDESVWRSWRLGWVVPIATAATAAGLWIALPRNPAVPALTDQALQTAARESASVPAPPAPPTDAVEPSPQSPPRLQGTARPSAGNETRKRADENDLAALRYQQQAPPASAASAPLARAEAAKPGEAANSPATLGRALAETIAIVPVEIVAPGGSARWRIISGQRVEWSTSADRDWESATIASRDILTTGVAPSSSVCWIVGRGGAIYLTTDGTRFIRLPFPEVADLVSVTASDDRNATVTSSDGRSWWTSDQGRTWTLRTAN